MMKIDDILDESKKHCLYLKKGSFQGISNDKIIDVTLLRKYLD